MKNYKQRFVVCAHLSGIIYGMLHLFDNNSSACGIHGCAWGLQVIDIDRKLSSQRNLVLNF